MPIFGPPNVGNLKAKNDVKGLLRALEEKNSWRVPGDAEKALMEIANPEAIQAFQTALQHKHPRVRKVAARCLGKIKDPRALDALIQAFNEDEDGDVQEAAAEGLGVLGDKRAVPHLISRLKSLLIGGRSSTTIIEALGALGDPRAVDILCTILVNRIRKPAQGNMPDPIPHNVINALEKLGELDNPRTIEALTVVMEKGNNPLLRSKAEDILEKLTAPSDDKSIQKNKITSSIVKGQKAVTNEPIISSGERWLQLVDEITSVDPEVRIKAAEELGRISDNNKAVNLLIIFVREHPRWEVRISAAFALGEIGDQNAAQDLANLYTEAVQTHDHEVTSKLVWIASALDKLGWSPSGGWHRVR